MSRMSEHEFADAIASTKKDKELVAAAKNDRTNSPGALHSEFSRLSIDRQLEVICSISNDYFVAAQWKIAFPLRNLPAELQKDAIPAAGEVLFFTRDEDSVRETVRAIKIYQESPFFRKVVDLLGDCAESTGAGMAEASRIVTDPDIYGMIRSLDPEHPSSERIVDCIIKTACYTRDYRSTIQAATFVYNRRYSPDLAEIVTLLEDSIFLARDRKSVLQILSGLGAGAIDMVLQKTDQRKELLSSTKEIAWKTRSAAAIRNHLRAHLAASEVVSTS